MFYPRELVEEVRIHNDIVNYIGTYVGLKQRGSSYVGLCPFHNESTPSFSVSSEKQMYHCFGCGESGNIYTFVMKIENIDFAEAVKSLADRARIALPTPNLSEEAKKKNELRQRLFKANKSAARFFYSALMSETGENIRQYLYNREISLKTIKRFGLGSSFGARKSLYDFLRGEGFDDAVLEQTGLLIKNKNGDSFLDRFYNRLMFPIFNVSGEVVGFGGRIVGEGEPKYLNSPQTELFDKGKCLYGLNFARTSKQRIIIVEGYMDVIALHQAGFTNAVAALGTAFGIEHAHILRKYTENVTVLFDSDAAGEKACLRAIQILANVGFRPKVLQVTGAKDPDEFIKKNGAEAFAVLLENAISYITFQINCIRKNIDTQNTEDVIYFTKNASKILSSIENPVEREAYINEVSKTSNIPYGAIKSEIERLTNQAVKIPDMPIDKKYVYKEPNKMQTAGQEALINAQKQLIFAMIEKYPVYLKVHTVLKSEEFTEDVYKKLADYVYQQNEKRQPIYAAEVIGYFETVDEQKAVGEVFSVQPNFVNISKSVSDQVKLIKKAAIEKKEREITDLNKIKELIVEKRNIVNLNINIEEC